MVAAGALGFTLSTHFGIIGGPDLREGLVAAARPFSLNPLIGGDDPAVRDIGHLLYRALLRLDDTAYPRPDLAASYTVSPDGLTYQLNLATGQRWSDGHAIAPDDVVETFAFAQSSRVVDRPIQAALAGVRVTAGHATVTVRLPAPRASFASTLAELPILPLGGLTTPQINNAAAHPNQPLATSGAERVLSDYASAILLEPNPYAAPVAHLQRVLVQLYVSFDDAAAAFAKGDIDAVLAITPDQRARLLAVKGAQAHDIATFRFVDLLFNERVRGLDDTVVRHAIGVALNRAAIVQGALQGTGGVAQADALSEGLRWIAAKSQETASLAAAATALDGAGWQPGPDGVRQRAGVALDYTLTVPNVDPLPSVAREVAQQVAAIGVVLIVQVVPAQSFVGSDVVPHTFELALADWDGGPDPDVSSFWRSNALPPLGFNVSGAAVDPFLDQALDRLATLTDPQARSAAAADVTRLLADDAPAVFLYTPDVSYVVRVPMKSMTVPPTGGSAARFDNLAAWQRG